MMTIFRIISGVIGLTILVGTVVLALNLLAMEPDINVLLAAYAGIGGILLGVFFLIYAFTGKWRPNQKRQTKER